MAITRTYKDQTLSFIKFVTQGEHDTNNKYHSLFKKMKELYYLVLQSDLKEITLNDTVFKIKKNLLLTQLDVLQSQVVLPESSEFSFDVIKKDLQDGFVNLQNELTDSKLKKKFLSELNAINKEYQKIIQIREMVDATLIVVSKDITKAYSQLIPAFDRLNSIEPIYKSVEDKLKLALLQEVLGNAYKYVHDYESAIPCFANALSILTKLPESGEIITRKIKLLFALGDCNFACKKFDSAIKVYVSLRDLYLKNTINLTNVSEQIVYLSNQLVLAYKKLAKLKMKNNLLNEAFEDLKIALNLLEKLDKLPCDETQLKNKISKKTSIYDNLVLIAYDLKKLEVSIQYTKAILSMLQEYTIDNVDVLDKVIKTTVLLSDLYLKQGISFENDSNDSLELLKASECYTSGFNCIYSIREQADRIQAFDKAIRHLYNNAAVLKKLGMQASENHDLNKALEYFEQSRNYLRYMFDYSIEMHIGMDVEIYKGASMDLDFLTLHLLTIHDQLAESIGNESSIVPQSKLSSSMVLFKRKTDTDESTVKSERNFKRQKRVESEENFKLPSRHQK